MEEQTFKKLNVELEGLADIMFDRFIDHSSEKRPIEQKLYLNEKNELVMPAENIYAFLFSENPAGCAKAFEGKKGKEYIRLGQGSTFVSPFHIPVLHNDLPVIIDKVIGDQFWVFEAAPRTKQGSLSIKQEIKPRPVLKLPWSLSFKIDLIESPIINENKLYNWFTRGGIEIGLGTYRPRFGRFIVSEFGEVKQ